MPELDTLPELIEVEDSLEQIQDFFETQGWTDGLPIVPPTVERVQEMLRCVDYAPEDVIAALPPLNGESTVRRIAISAVMAGCRPEYLPVLIAAVQAVAQPEFNLNGVQSTTHPCALAIIVNGPLREELSINSGANCFGQGTRANATIGRALRLIALNVGGGTPGEGDKATQGTPAKFSYCAAENEEASPWLPNHVEHGFDPLDSTVTLLAAEAPHNINNHVCKTAAEMLDTVVASMSAAGTNDRYGMGSPMIVFGPEHAATVAGDGFSKDDIRRYVWDRVYFEPGTPGLPVEDVVVVPGSSPGRLSPTAADLHVIVAGGPGKHSCWLPTFGRMTTVMRRIERKDGQPVRSVYA